MERTDAPGTHSDGSRLLSISVETPEGTHIRGNLLDSTRSRLVLLADEEGAPKLSPGGTVELRMRVGESEHSLPATVLGSSPSGAFQRYAFALEVEDPGTGVDGSSGYLRRIFNRRISHRVPIATCEDAGARLVAMESGVVVTTKLVDVSTSGACFEVALEDAVLLDDVERLHVELKLPGTSQAIRLDADVRQWRFAGRSTLLAIEFVPDETLQGRRAAEGLLEFVSERLATLRRAAA